MKETTISISVRTDEDGFVVIDNHDKKEKEVANDQELLAEVKRLLEAKKANA